MCVSPYCRIFCRSQGGTNVFGEMQRALVVPSWPVVQQRRQARWLRGAGGPACLGNPPSPRKARSQRSPARHFQLPAPGPVCGQPAGAHRHATPPLHRAGLGSNPPASRHSPTPSGPSARDRENVFFSKRTRRATRTVTPPPLLFRSLPHPFAAGASRRSAPLRAAFGRGPRRAGPRGRATGSATRNSVFGARRCGNVGASVRGLGVGAALAPRLPLLR